METSRRTIIVILGAMLSLGVIAGLSLRRHERLYRMTVLPSLGGRETWPMAVNDRGQVVGYGEAVDGTCHLFLWDPARGRVRLSRHVPVGKGEALLAFDLNDRGCITGVLLSRTKRLPIRAVLLEPIPQRWGDSRRGNGDPPGANK